MRTIVLLTCFLLAFLLAAPAMAAVAEPAETDEIIHGVTLEPVTETTYIITSAPPTEQPAERPVTREPETPVTDIPGPKVGWLTIISTPSGAEVTIDGEAAGATPITGREVGAGSHSVSISMPGFETYQTEKSVGAGEQAAVDATLNEIVIPTTAPTTRVTIHPEPTVTDVPCIGCDRGWIRVYCNVNGATVSFDQLSSGCTIANGYCDTDVATTGTAFRSFTVQKPGYEIFTGSVSSWPARGQTVSLYSTLIPVQSYGNIQVDSRPQGAVVTLDGSIWQNTPTTFTSVSAGTHTLQISMNGYQPYGTSVYVTAGKTASVNAYLVPNPPQPRTGSLNIVTSPKGADIYVDGTYYAETPYIVTSLAPGPHNLRMYKAGYDEYMSTVTVNAGQQTPISWTFTPQQGSVGSIDVYSTPAGSAVYLDGNYMGQTPYGGSLDIPSVLAGTHTVSLRLQDYKSYTQTVTVRAGEVVTVNAQLTPSTPSPVPDTTGQIMVVSTPAGAELFIDNTFRGITPATIPDIPAGSHVVMVRQAGYTDATQTVTVTGGQSTPVALSLAPVPVTTTKTPMSPVAGLGAVALAGLAVLYLGKRE
ncbi:MULTISPECIES: PEGA domain-containing protein [unclassified Methanoregula]|uniref:PEGA domain-containing protein n=1 Tax=unclassified Methanoregula TaxID=2649730 RepID=UPI0009C51007|nr:MULTISPECIES: PEGA domain-containing protein [unclassified Methanoregula]OPX63861.1 MAG: PEGA domain protein [Methanoregula sp. PtaB.Bin085]OPY35414.1 MAG: PEGA domain protein [Methanoregula sp. PtaU1.Bin006]